MFGWDGIGCVCVYELGVCMSICVYEMKRGRKEKVEESERGKESKTKSEIGIRKIALLKVSAYSIGC